MASAKPKKKNPRLASGRKRVRQDIKINAANSSLRSKYRTAVKNVEKAVAAGDKAKATELFAKMQTVVDIIADKGIFHKNKAARDKSRLSAKVKTLALAAAWSAPPDQQPGEALSSLPFETGALSAPGSPRCTCTPRKVRTSQSKVVGNTHPEKSAGLVPQKIDRTWKCVRVKRWCKRPPVFVVMQIAW